MAIYHLSAKPPIARSQGRCATAAMAYRAAIAIRDERTGQMFDYSRRRGVIGARLILPGGVCVMDRPGFWNQVEQHHRRKDAVTAREVVVALPNEIDADQRAVLAFEFARNIANQFSVAVDCALHAPSVTGDDRNFHAHLMLTACTVGVDGALGKKADSLDPILCRRAGQADSVAWLRPHWAALVNEALATAGFSNRVDHRSHQARRIDRLPTIHVGPRGSLAQRRSSLNRRLTVKNVEVDSIEHEMAALRSTRSRLMKPAQPTITSREQARRRLEFLLMRSAEAEARLSQLPSLRGGDKMKLKQLIATYGKELRSLIPLMKRFDVRAVARPLATVTGTERRDIAMSQLTRRY